MLIRTKTNNIYNKRKMVVVPIVCYKHLFWNIPYMFASSLFYSLSQFNGVNKKHTFISKLFVNNNTSKKA